MIARLKGTPLRIATAAVAIPSVVALVWYPRLHGGFAILVGCLCAVGLYEYYAIVRARRILPETIGGIIAGTTVALSGYFSSIHAVNLTLFCGCLLVSLLHILRGQHTVAGLASSVFGLFYIGWFGAHSLLLLRTDDVGTGLMTILLMVVMLTDSVAFAAGKAWGRTKLAPKVSPNKTWEGAIAGFVAAVIGMAVLYVARHAAPRAGLPDWSLPAYLGTGAVLSVVAQIGDLMESCLKRDAGVKDSGSFFPGHGGVLDRCDGFLFATPILYYIYVPIILRA